MKNRFALGIIFRIPEYGKVKSRLARQIGHENALAIYTLMLNKTIENVSNLRGVDIYGFYDGDKSKAVDFIKRLCAIPQEGKDLGERMLNVIRWLFGKGYDKVILIGADSPDLPLCYIEDAFSRLNHCELVIGPAMDGGYYLIGMNRFLKGLFEGIEWGRNTVAEDTILKAQNNGIKYFLLPYWYDIDDIDGLKRSSGPMRQGWEISGLEIRKSIF